jgi:hypothetical protein
MAIARPPLLAAVLAVTLTAIAPAGAAQISGQQLLSLCAAGMSSQEHRVEAAECLGFIVGVADTFDCMETNHGFTWNSRAGASQPELVGIVVQFLQSHPAMLPADGHRAVGAALAASFPCSPKTAAN